MNASRVRSGAAPVSAVRAACFFAFALIEAVMAVVFVTVFSVTADDPPYLLDDVLALWDSREFWLYTGAWFGGIVIAQCALLLPVRKPAARRERGVSLLASLAAAALGMALLATGLVFVLLELASMWAPMVDHTKWGGWAMLAIPLAAWMVFTPMLILFARGMRRETALSRLASGLFLGSIVEALAVIPLDVMVRRRTDCYCGESTFWTLLLCGTVGIFAFGPGLFLVLLARRRKRWWAGRCEWCGYDMSGTKDADRCPECGAGWRA